MDKLKLIGLGVHRKHSTAAYRPKRIEDVSNVGAALAANEELHRR